MSLYEVSVTIDDDEDHFAARIIEAPDFRPGTELAEWAYRFAFEQSVIWGFVPVKLEVSAFFPMRVGWKADNGSEVRSLLTEQTVHVTKEFSA